MRMILAMVMMGACMAFAGEETNEAAVPLTFSTNVVLTDKRLKLTPEMERLNRSPYFESWVNEFKGFMINRIQRNEVGDRYDRPNIELNARRVIYADGREKFELQVFTFATDARYAFVFPSNQVLQLVVDGAMVSVQCDPKYDYLGYEPEESKSVAESVVFPVPPQVIQGIGRARKVQMRLETKYRTATRDLSSTNIARFALFSKMFISSNSLARVTMGEEAR